MQKKNKTTSFEINKTVTNSVKNPGTVSRLTAAVIVAPEAGTTPEKSETRKNMLRSMVANALGVKGTEQELKRIVTIEEMPFDPMIPEPKGLMSSITENWSLVKDAGAVLVALLVFGAFVRMLRKTKPDEIPMELLYPNEEEIVTTDSAASAASGKGSGASAPKVTQPVTVELINEMIRRKPENVSAAIKNWVGEEKPS
jgi:flagellar M-ring protein FliF